MWRVCLLVIFAVGCSKRQEHIVKREVPGAFAPSLHEDDTENSKTLAKDLLHRLSVERTDGGAYLKIKSIISSVELDADEASAVGARLQEFEKFCERTKDLTGDTSENFDIGDSLRVEFSKSAKNGFRAVIMAKKPLGGAVLDRKGVADFLPHLLRAREIIEEAGRAK